MECPFPPPPPLPGSLAEGVPLASRTTWRIGGRARWLATFKDVVDLLWFWTRLDPLTPRFVLGGGSNLLINDEGFGGVVLDLTSGLNRIQVEESPASVLSVQAGALTRTLAHTARRLGLGGAEFLAGIPGSIGGAVVMNAGAHGREMKDILIDAQLLDPQGRQHSLTPDALAMSYRQSRIPPGWLVLSARLRLTPEDPERIRQTMQRYNRHRLAAQPVGQPSAGSTFKNPVAAPPAWQLIEAAGLRDASIGQARVSSKHCNFFVNMGQATATDMRQLVGKVRDAVFDHSGIRLESEVEYLGRLGLEPMVRYC
ncbi:MAG: UDP-N-acetylmuramate dehydrogenase [Magnetococcales bacterium]|nr:UDP-N-acetylmuramate dehydrogenase [Magnetococcales bacterium]